MISAVCNKYALPVSTNEFIIVTVIRTSSGFGVAIAVSMSSEQAWTLSCFLLTELLIARSEAFHSSLSRFKFNDRRVCLASSFPLKGAFAQPVSRRCSSPVLPLLVTSDQLYPVFLQLRPLGGLR